MDEKLLDLLDMALAERFQLAYFALRESDPQVEELAQTLITLSESILNDPKICQRTKDDILQYLEGNSELDAKIQKDLYIQGTKDCVTVLRELGVIK